MLKSVRVQLTVWYISSISLLVLIFGGITFFSLKTTLLRNLDNALYNGGELLGKTLSEYTLKNEDDPRSLHEVSEEDEFFVEKIDEEANDIFFVSMMYVQLRVFPELI